VTASPALLFTLALLFAGLGGGAVVSRLLSGEPDPERRAEATAAFALPTGLILAALPGWLPSGFFHVSIDRVALPLGALFLLVLIVLFGKSLLDTFAAARRVWAPFALALGVFLFFLWLRWPTGDVRFTEKPMDLAVLSGLMTTGSLPFADPWMSGARFPYYHFGTLLFALPARASRVPPEYAYNLIAALLPALAALAAYGAVRIRGGGRRLGVLAGLLFTLGGTPDALRQWLADRPLADINFWESSRRVHDVVNGKTGDCITEWPLFTFRLADLHPHAMTLPLVALLAGLLGRVATIPGVVFDAVLVAAVLAANPWDLPAVLLLLAAGNLAERPFLRSVARALFTLAIAAFFLVPSLLSPRPRFRGLTFWPPGTAAVEAFLHFGALAVVPALALGIAVVRSKERNDAALFVACLFPAIGILAAIATRKPVLGLAAGFLAGIAWLLFRPGRDGAAGPPEGALRAGFLFAAAGVALAATPDAVVVTDTYGEQLARMNTVFKTFSDAWPLLALGTALLLPLALSTRQAAATIRVFLSLALLATLVHPLAAAVVRMKQEGGSLDGLRWVARDMPGDRAAVDWLRLHAAPGAVIAEATGNPYSDYARIGFSTGRPTVLGWANHEGLWRAEAGEAEIRGRQADLNQLYTSTDVPSVIELVRRRRIDYIIWGFLEQKDFAAAGFPARGGFRKVFSEGATAIYEPMQ
jgi:YYY domain-containing protein